MNDDELPHDAVRRLAAEMKEQPGTRFTDRIEFVVMVPEDEFADADWSTAPARVAAVLLEGTEPSLELSIREEGLGRGADGMAVAIEVITTAAAIAGGVLTSLGTAREVMALWRWLRRRSKPVLSVGALKLLCAADLEQRLGSLDRVRLLDAADIGGGREVDAGFTGEDYFTVVFRRDWEMLVYVVDSYGRIVHFGRGSVDPRVEREFYMLEGPAREQAEKSVPPPFLGEED